MLDVLIWPWFERAKALTILYKQRASLDKERFPRIVSKKIVHPVTVFSNLSTQL